MKIKKFNGTDFEFWKMQIEDYLYEKNLAQPLSKEKPAGMKDEEWALLDRKALGVIRLTLAQNVLFNIVTEKTTAGLMAALSNMYKKPSISNKVYLMRRLFNLKMSEGASIVYHLNEFNNVTSQLSSVKIELDDEIKALILLSSLPISWNDTVTMVSISSGTTKLKYDDVRDLVLSAEIHRKKLGESSRSANIESRGRTSERSYSNKSNFKNRSKSRYGKLSDGCWNCGKRGHIERDCWVLKKKG